MDALKYAILGAKNITDKFTPEELPPKGRFHYHQGVFLTGLERIYEITGDTKYSNYIKEWADCYIDENGNAPCCHYTDEFDDIQPGMLLFRIYRETGDRRYRILLNKMADAVEKSPTNAKGGVWHKKMFRNQMWLDTMYMMGVFSVMYALEFGNPYLIEKVRTQMRLMSKYMTDKETGLLYHMWDDSKRMPLSNPQTGLSGSFWGRAIGWFAAATAEIFEILPESCSCRDEFKEAAVNILSSVIRYQDKETGLWYQVVDKTDDSRNWLETSCSALFTYALAKLLRLGVLKQGFKEAAQNGYNGVLTKAVIDNAGTLNLTDVCVGTGVCTLEGYFKRPRVANDLHGMGAFLMMCTEVYKAGI